MPNSFSSDTVETEKYLRQLRSQKRRRKFKMEKKLEDRW